MAPRDRLVAGVEADDDLDELHHRHGREEVQAEHAVGVGTSRPPAPAIGIDEVFDARTASSPTTPASIFMIEVLSSTFSGTASITRSAPATSSSSLVSVIRASAESRSAASSLPRLDPPIQGGIQPLTGGVKILRQFADHDGKPGNRGGFSDACTHEATTDDG